MGGSFQFTLLCSILHFVLKTDLTHINMLVSKTPVSVVIILPPLRSRTSVAEKQRSNLLVLVLAR